MDIAVSYSQKENTNQAVQEACDHLITTLPGPPDFLIVYYTEFFNPRHIADNLLRTFPDAAVHGASTSRGIMVNDGFIAGRPGVLSLFGIHDPEGDYGVGIRFFKGDPRAAGAGAVRDSLENAGRPGESPHYIWMTATPGHEEEVLAGIESVLGPNVPVLGGSAADDTVSGDWSVIGNHTSSIEGVTVSAVFPSREPEFSFHSGYAATSKTGVVTRAKNRILKEINDRPAALVYNEWAGGVLEPVLPEGGNVLELTTWYPLARVKHYLGEIPLYLLSHPAKVFPDSSISLFTDIREYDRITLMAGNQENLISRAARVVESAMSINDYAPDEIRGALIVFCAGSMLTVSNTMQTVHQKIKSALGNIPFLTFFSFGEQGCLMRGANYHGNLMVAVILFSDQPSAL